MDCIKLVFKTPRERHGMVYVGSLTFPFAEFSYVIKVQCAEFGVSGMRDAIVMDKLMGEGAVSLDPETKAISGWSGDPYDAGFKANLLCHKSDLESYDADFPDHPLTEMRKHLASIQASVKADDSVMRSLPFSAGAQPHSNGHNGVNGGAKDASNAEKPREEVTQHTSAPKGKPWWKVW
jgi:hypothetical protein